MDAAVSTATDQAWIAAWARARAEKLIPYRTAAGDWAVKDYTVRVTGPGWRDLACTCDAGRHGRICKHAAVTAKAIRLGVSPIYGTAAVSRPVVLPFVPACVRFDIPSPLDALFG